MTAVAVRWCMTGWGALVLAVLAPACMLRARPDPTRFYVLAASASDPPPPGALAVGLGPITMPGYLQHAMLVRRPDSLQIAYSDVDRWAEPLPALFGRTLGQDLAAVLGARIVPYPWSRSTPVDVVVRVDVTAFEANAENDAQLAACWTVRDTRGTTPCHEECSTFVTGVEGRDTDALVIALSRAVDELAHRLADAVRTCRRAAGAAADGHDMRAIPDPRRSAPTAQDGG